jgi:hypothetical protein
MCVCGFFFYFSIFITDLLDGLVTLAQGKNNADIPCPFCRELVPITFGTLCSCVAISKVLCHNRVCSLPPQIKSTERVVVDAFHSRSSKPAASEPLSVPVNNPTDASSTTAASSAVVTSSPRHLALVATANSLESDRSRTDSPQLPAVHHLALTTKSTSQSVRFET